jgi:formylglycine-generating enzyme required for sulfatase activity
VCLIFPLLAVLLPVGADSVPPSLSQVEIIPASAGTPPTFTGIVTGGPPNGTAWLQASVDLGVADPWTNVATATLDNLGAAAFTAISDSRPQAAAAEQDFFRIVTSAGPPLGTMVFIPGGTFQMGDAFSEGYSDELPVHSVYVSGFYLQNTEVTKDQWDAVREWGVNHGFTDLAVGNGSYLSKGANHPVHSINWYDIVKYCNARSQMEGLTPCYTSGGLTYMTGTDAGVVCNWSASGYRLPTEAEWEKAARGGLSGKRFPWGDNITHSQANYSSSSIYDYDVSPTRGYHPTYAVGNTPYSSPVGSFAANGYGLYDMTGNVWEWCWDWAAYYPSTSQTDPRGPTSRLFFPYSRIFRGGSWSIHASPCRTAYRSYTDPTYSGYHIGFRPARSSVP